MELKSWIKKCEGFNRYPDVGHDFMVSIGYGRKLDNGISKEEACILFDNDFARCQNELASFSWYYDQPQNVQDALLNMCFNLGIQKLLGFRKMITALIDKDYTNAAIEVINSEWGARYNERAKDVALLIRQAHDCK
jgi:lysozyme